MNYRLAPYALYRAAEAVNAMKEAVPTWTQVGTVRAAVSAATGGSLQRINELMRLESTHTAATWDAVEVGDRLRPLEDDGAGTGYRVEYIIPGGRRKMHQLFLKRTDDPPNREEATNGSSEGGSRT